MEQYFQKVAIVGLGLIGGSIAKVIKVRTKTVVVGVDINVQTCTEALEQNAVDEIREQNRLADCDLIVVGLYPKQTVDFIVNNIETFKKGALIVDLCGVKRYVCEQLEKAIPQHELFFIGGHPMAGREFSGFEYSTSELFEKASILLTPSQAIPIEKTANFTEFLYTLGFSKVINTTPENHDKMIAFTSQLAHIVSSAYIKSETATAHKGYSAGSFKDLTRVARLNEPMWSELMLLNRDNLLREIDGVLKNLSDYRDVIEQGDDKKLRFLLKEGSDRKVTLD